RAGTFAMRGEPEENGISLNLYPNMTTGIACPPLEQHQGVIFLKLSSSSQLILVDFLEHLRKATLSQYTLCIFAKSKTCRCDFVFAEHLLIRFVLFLYLFFFPTRNTHLFISRSAWCVLSIPQSTTGRKKRQGVSTFRQAATKPPSTRKAWVISGPVARIRPWKLLRKNRT